MLLVTRRTVFMKVAWVTFATAAVFGPFPPLAAADVLSFSLPDTLGREVRATDYAGAPVLVVAGACWCGGCQLDAEPLRQMAEKYGSKGLRVIRSVSGDNELESLEFQKHYRLPFPQVLDTNREFEKRYNRDGWPFIMVADKNGKIVYRTNDLVDRSEVEVRVRSLPLGTTPATSVMRGGVAYPTATIDRNGERDSTRQRDAFPSLIFGADDRGYLLFTSNRNGNNDLFLRVLERGRWSNDKPLVATAADEFYGVLALDHENRPWVCWSSNPGQGKYNIFVAAIAENGTLVAPTKLTEAEDDAMHPAMACDAGGRIWVAYYKWLWFRGRSRDKEIYIKYLERGRWSAEIHVSPEDVPWYEDHSDPCLVALNDGVAVFWSWDYHRPKGYPAEPELPTIFMRSISPGPSLGVIHAISANTIDTMPGAALDNTGRLWCAWESIDWDKHARANRKSLLCRSIEVGSPLRKGAHSHADAVQEASCSDTSCLAHAPLADGKVPHMVNVSRVRRNICTPRLVTSPHRGTTLVWSEIGLDGKWQIRCADLGKGGRWSEPMVLAAQGNPRFPSAAYDNEGDLWVAYAASTEKGTHIVVQKRPSRK